MYSCPACGARNLEERATCRCGADLSLLQTLEAAVDAWFNRALAALAEGAPGKALEWLSACCVANPNDATARRAQARVWAQLGHPKEAEEALERARIIDPAAPELQDIQAAIEEARTPIEHEETPKEGECDCPEQE